jgi:hypothetical protein
MYHHKNRGGQVRRQRRKQLFQRVNAPGGRRYHDNVSAFHAILETWLFRATSRGKQIGDGRSKAQL